MLSIIEQGRILTIDLPALLPWESCCWSSVLPGAAVAYSRLCSRPASRVAQKLSADADCLSATERLAIDRALLLSDAINQSFLVLDQCRDLDGRIAQLGMIRDNLQQLRELCKQNTCLTVNLDQIQSEFERRIRSGLPPQLTNS